MLAFVRESSDPVSPADIVTRFGANPQYVRNTFCTFNKRGLINRVGYGLYSAYVTAPIEGVCTCGHPKPEHADPTTRCIEPTRRCGCLEYAELCPECRHVRNAHNGACERIIQRTWTPCRCLHYAE